jgi:hypothetical protein
MGFSLKNLNRWALDAKTHLFRFFKLKPICSGFVGCVYFFLATGNLDIRRKDLGSF